MSVGLKGNIPAKKQSTENEDAAITYLSDNWFRDPKKAPASVYSIDEIVPSPIGLSTIRQLHNDDEVCIRWDSFGYPWAVLTTSRNPKTGKEWGWCIYDEHARQLTNIKV